MHNLFAQLRRRAAGLSALVSRKTVFFAALGAASLGMTGVAGAATPTYDITPVVTGLTNDLAANVPVILAVVGGLIAIGIAVHMVRRWVRP